MSHSLPLCLTSILALLLLALLTAPSTQTAAAINVDVRSDLFARGLINPDRFLQSKGLRGVHKMLLPDKDLVLVAARGRDLIARMDYEDGDYNGAGQANPDHSPPPAAK